MDKLELLRRREVQLKARIAIEEESQRRRKGKATKRRRALLGRAADEEAAENPEFKQMMTAVVARRINGGKDGDREFLRKEGWV